MMPSSPPLVVAPVLGLAAYCLAHLIAARLFARRGPYLPLMLGFGVGLTATAAVTLWALIQPPAAAINDVLGFLVMNLVAYGALGWCYFHFVNLCIASLRIRVLEEIIDAGGELPAITLEGLYDNRRMIALRIERLTGGGHLVYREERFYSGKPQFLIVARIFDLLRWCILGSTLPRRTGRPTG